jgi:hypothetical protein
LLEIAYLFSFADKPFPYDWPAVLKTRAEFWDSFGQLASDCGLVLGFQSKHCEYYVMPAPILQLFFRVTLLKRRGLRKGIQQHFLNFTKL